MPFSVHHTPAELYQKAVGKNYLRPDFDYLGLNFFQVPDSFAPIKPLKNGAGPARWQPAPLLLQSYYNFQQNPNPPLPILTFGPPPARLLTPPGIKRANGRVLPQKSAAPPWLSADDLLTLQTDTEVANAR